MPKASQDLFILMQGNYQQKWIIGDSFENAPLAWKIALRDLTESEIQLGYKLCKTEYPEWPPSANAFERMAKSQRVKIFKKEGLPAYKLSKESQQTIEDIKRLFE